MSAKQKLHQIRLNEWTSRFADQKAGCLSVRKWCEQNQVSIHTYNYWKHALKEELVDQLLPNIVPAALPVPANLPSPAGILPALYNQIVRIARIALQ